jgi:hypothetical protein
MARSEEDIIKELEDSIQSTDKTLDVTQGPIPDIFIRPQAGQLAIASEEAESLRQLFTLDFEVAATEEEIRNALSNYGSTPGEGVKSRHVQTFLKFTRPSEDILIPAGTLVSNASGALIYRVVTAGTLTEASASTFFNAARNAFEISLLVEAIGVGEEFNLPQNRINTIVTPVAGIDSTENRTASTGGASRESKEEQSTRLKTSLLGRNLGSPGGVKGLITETLPEIITDVNVVQPFESEFTRLIVGPALDLYNIGTVSEPFTQTFTALGGETQILLTKVPAISITALTVNNLSGVIGFTLVSDTTPETGSSLAATDIVVLDTPLIVGDFVVIAYQYNKALEDVQSTVFAEGAEFLFNTDILVRSPFIVNPRIVGEIQALASFSVTEVEEDINTFLTTEFTFTTFIETVFPEVIRQRVITEVSGVQNFRITEFRRATGSLSDVEPMVFARNEVSVFNPDIVDVTVIS